MLVAASNLIITADKNVDHSKFCVSHRLEAVLLAPYLSEGVPGYLAHCAAWAGEWALQETIVAAGLLVLRHTKQKCCQALTAA